ncbi:MAG: prephenate dehydratase domain-containing protein [Metallosphaera sp.]
MYYLGPEGSFSHEAALKVKEAYTSKSSISEIFDGVSKGALGVVPVENTLEGPVNETLVSKSSISEIFDGVSKGALGVVPVENTLEGPVNETLDNLYARDEIYVNRRIDIKIDLVLAASPDAKKESIERVYSHNHAIHEAKRTLSRLGFVNFVPVASTSKAAQLASEDIKSAAVCSRLAAQIYGLKILHDSIQDGLNITRFLVISKELSENGERTILLFTVPDKPGSLYKVLEKFYLHNINLSMIYSRPTRKIPWNYYFYLEYEGDMISSKHSGLLNELRQATQELKPKGSYTFLNPT